MKRIKLFLIISGFVACFPLQDVSSQASKLDFTTKIKNTSGVLKKDGAIYIKITTDSAPYTVGITNISLPDQRSDFLFLEEDTYTKELTISSLKKGTYYLFIKDSNGVVKISELQIEKAKN